MPSWTKMQQAAIDQRGAHVLVSAAAGSGKTAVLTERVMQRLIGSHEEAPIGIDQFLIVTFTTAAAQEMKERIMQKVTAYIDELSELEEDHTQELEYLEHQIALLPKASISTIHSFCLKIMRDYFNHLDIDPNVKVGNEGELAIMRNEILDDLIEEYLDYQDPEFLALAEVYGSAQGLEGLKELILEVSTFSKSTPFPKLWLQEQVKKLKKPYNGIDEMPWAVAFGQQIRGKIDDLEAIYQKALKVCKEPNGPELYEEAISSDLLYLEAVIKAGSLSDKIEAIKAIDFKPLSRKKQECDLSKKEQAKQYRDLAKEEIKKLQEDMKLISDEKLLKQLPYAGQLMQSLVQVIERFEAEYTERKMEKGVLDYNDLEQYALKLLVRPVYNETGELSDIGYTEVAKELSRFYKEVYMDEYQDTNTVQETILKAISEADGQEGPTRFMVGDMKQSIYRFRLANPLIFAEKYESWQKHKGEMNQDAKEICIDLSQNFRSRVNILEGVNDLFKQVMSYEVGELTYDEHAQLYVGNHYEEGEPTKLPEGSLSEAMEFHILETLEQETPLLVEGETEGGEENLKNVEWEAKLTAHLIDQLLKGESNPTHVFDKEMGEYRKVEPRDIVILLRTMKGKADVFEKALMSKGIGAYAEVGSLFFEAIEVQVMMSLLKIINNPLQDIPLLTVLRSPIVGLSYDELACIRSSQETGCFYEAIKAYQETQQLSEPLERFITQLEIYREDSKELKVEELLAKIYRETGYYRYIGMFATGAKKKGNLDLLQKYAAEYESNQYGKLFGFIQYLEQLSQTSEGLQAAKIVEGNENLVRIVSIHKSKGLEFPIVFLGDTAKKFNHMDLKKEVLLHSDLGLAPSYIDTEKHIKYPTLPKLAVKEQIKSENISEEMRILYVALTRAKEKLFITAHTPNLQKAVEKWQLFASREEIAIMPLGVKNAENYFNWIGMSLYAHQGIEDFRNLTQEQSKWLFEGKSQWQVKVWHKEDLGSLERERDSLLQQRREVLEKWDNEKDYSGYKEQIEEQLDFSYPFEASITLPAKVSVSEIKRQQVGVEENYDYLLYKEQENNAYVPSFMKEQEEIQGAQRGTLIHSVLEHLNYKEIMTEEEIQSVIEKLIEENILKPEVQDVINYKRLSLMTQSPVINKMRASQQVEKEKAFMYLAQASRISPEYPEDEKILIQGVIDAYFIDEEGITLIDYKTDHIDLKNKAQSVHQIKEKYRVQLKLYAEALSEITNIRVAHQYIYLYNINEWLEL